MLDAATNEVCEVGGKLKFGRGVLKGARFSRPNREIASLARPAPVFTCLIGTSVLVEAPPPIFTMRTRSSLPAEASIHAIPRQFFKLFPYNTITPHTLLSLTHRISLPPAPLLIPDISRSLLLQKLLDILILVIRRHLLQPLLLGIHNLPQHLPLPPPRLRPPISATRLGVQVRVGPGQLGRDL